MAQRLRVWLDQSDPVAVSGAGRLWVQWGCRAACAPCQEVEAAAAWGRVEEGP